MSIATILLSRLLFLLLFTGNPAKHLYHCFLNTLGGEVLINHPNEGYVTGSAVKQRLVQTHSLTHLALYAVAVNCMLEISLGNSEHNLQRGIRAVSLHIAVCGANRKGCYNLAVLAPEKLIQQDATLQTWR